MSPRTIAYLELIAIILACLLIGALMSVILAGVVALTGSVLLAEVVGLVCYVIIRVENLGMSVYAMTERAVFGTYRVVSKSFVVVGSFVSGLFSRNRVAEPVAA